MTKTIAIIAAHPDDEVLGCGGTIAKATIDGIKVLPIIACEGFSVRHSNSEDENLYKKQLLNSCKILKTEDPILLNYPDQQLDQISILEITQKLENILENFKPSIVFIHDKTDLNQDHKQLTHASLVASRPTFSFIDAVYMFNTPSSTEWGFPRDFKPDRWVDISSTLEVKIKAFECYKTEIKSFPHPRSTECLISHAKYWGSHQLINYAEVFRTVWNRSRIY